MFEAEELRRILAAATSCVRAMVLLGINGGMGNHDVATLPMTAVDLERGLVDFPRPKTEVERNIPLWPETVQAIREWLAVRPEAKQSEDDGLVFLTRQRRSWARSGQFQIDLQAVEATSWRRTAASGCVSSRMTRSRLS